MSNSRGPVFVVGCPRSGTTLLYHMLLSSGNFALFPLESRTFDILGRRFPNLLSPKRRARLVEYFIHTDNFTAAGIERSVLESRTLSECRNIADFLRIVMEEMCRKQGVSRWAEKTPYHVLYITEIKRLIPDALIVHIIRDGRDAALSMSAFGLDNPYPWECGGRRLAMAVRWKWMVRKGRSGGREIGQDYYELHYEDLVEKPRETLVKLGGFIGQALDYDGILQAGVGSVRQPETSFPGQHSNPVGRWKVQCSPGELAILEGAVGDCLEELGYVLASEPAERRLGLRGAASVTLNLAQLELKHCLKSNTPLGRLAGWTTGGTRIRRPSEAV